ncbi:hypothetical protein [Aliikangiella maris]|uniref:Uncharacterized protein n=2 Tax=Aliikangiella maris TaxID=3162458 RepID=A0ABV3MQC5_9GAMM
MKLFSKNKALEYVVVTITQQSYRIHHLKNQDNQLQQLAFGEFEYESIEALQKQFTRWIRKSQLKGLPCRWVLNRELYQTFQIDPPNVETKEMSEAIRWQIKDLIEQPLSDMLVSHYQPEFPEEQRSQLVAVVVEKALIEALIELTSDANLILEVIDIEELTMGHALQPYLAEEKVVGYIGEDKGGLMFSFYLGHALAFSRYKKGKHLPNTLLEEFSLEEEKETLEESFLLEAQRTLDYVVSQIFRRPIDAILFHPTASEDNYLADILKQITEVEVILVSPEITQSNPEWPLPSLAESGCLFRQGD